MGVCRRKTNQALQSQVQTNSLERWRPTWGSQRRWVRKYQPPRTRGRFARPVQVGINSSVPLRRRRDTYVRLAAAIAHCPDSRGCTVAESATTTCAPHMALKELKGVEQVSFVANKWGALAFCPPSADLSSSE